MGNGVGKDSIFKLANGSDALTAITSYITGITPKKTAAAKDVTTMGKSSEVYVGGLKGATIGLAGKLDSSNSSTAIYQILVNALGKSRAFEWGPFGSGTGSIKETGAAICTSFDVDDTLADELKWTANLQVSDDITFGVY